MVTLTLSILFLLAAFAATLSYYLQKQRIVGWLFVLGVLFLMIFKGLVTMTDVNNQVAGLELNGEFLTLSVSILLFSGVIWLGSIREGSSACEHINQEADPKRVSLLNVDSRDEPYQLSVLTDNEGDWDWCLEKNTFYISPRWIELLDFGEADDRKGFIDPLKIIHKNDLITFEDMLSSYLKDRSPLDRELRFRSMSGSYLWFHLRGVRLRNQNNTVTRIVGTMSDISNRKQKELFLELENELLKSVSQDIPLSSLLEYLVIEIEKMEEEFILAIGINIHDDINKYEIISPSLDDKIREELRKQFAQTRVGVDNINWEFKYVKVGDPDKRKEPKWYNLHQGLANLNVKSYWSFPITNAQGRELATFNVCSKRSDVPLKRDQYFLNASIELISLIMSQYQEQNTIQNFESLFQTIFEQAAVGVALVNSESGEFLQTNKQFFYILGYELHEAVNLSYGDVILEEDKLLWKSKLDAMLKEGMVNFNVELRFVHKTGKVFWGEINVSQLWHNQNNSLTHIAVFQEISSRKFAEENLKFHSEVLENIEECIMVVRCDDKKVVYVNSRFERIFGYTSENIFLQKVTKLLGQGTNHRNTKAKDIIYLLEQHGFWKGELFGQRKNGSEFWCRVNITTYEHPEFGKTWIVILDDITMMKSAEDSAIKMDKLESIGILAGGIAHDFNNILVGVFANISLLRDRLGSSNAQDELLNDTLAAMNRAKGLTTQLLTFSKGGKPIKEEASLYELLAETIKFDLSGSNVISHFEVQDDLWNAEVDRGQIQQVFSNLTINAKEGMPEGGVIHVRLTNCNTDEIMYTNLDPGFYVLISFSDQGTGIPPEELGHIFEPYFSTKQSGNGLGLATSFSIIKRHGGHILVDSELGKGTTFSVYLPASRSCILINAPKFKASNSAKENGVSSVRGLKILIMDDQEMILKAMNLILMDNGHQVVLSADVKTAIDEYKVAWQSREPFDLIILDLTVPGGVGGLECLAEIRKINPRVLAIASSGYVDNDVMADYKEKGFHGIVPKPYTCDELMWAVENTMNSAQY